LRIVKFGAAVAASALLIAACGGTADTTTEAPAEEAPAAEETAAAAPAGDLRIVNVVKLIGVGWFDRMEQGIAEFAAATGIDAK